MVGYWNIVNKLYKIPEEVKHIMWLTAIRSILYSALNLFLPAFLIYSYDLKTAIIFLSLQYSFFYTFVSINFFRKLIKKIPLETTQILSVIFGVMGIVLIAFWKGWFSIIISSFLLNLQNAFYWIPKHLVIVKFAEKKDEMKEAVTIDNISRILSFITPLVSSYIIYLVGYRWYYSIITFIIVTSLIYIFERIKDKKTVIRKDVKINYRFLLLFLLEGIIAGSFLLTTTALLFFNLKLNIKFYGIVRSVGVIATILLTYYVAKMIDNKHNLKVSLISLFLLSISLFVFNYLRDNHYFLSLLVVFISFLYDLGSLSPTSFLYESSKYLGEEIILGREILINVGRMFILLLTLLSQSVIYLSSFLVLFYVVVFYRKVIKHNPYLN